MIAVSEFQICPAARSLDQNYFLTLKFKSFHVTKIDLQPNRVLGKDCKKEIPDYFGIIEFFPSPKKRSYSQECSWIFVLPEHKQFVLKLEFTYLSNYNEEDTITLPDGKITLLILQLKYIL